eukprot:1137245-Pelagomonas_calceolata.AAC.1
MNPTQLFLFHHAFPSLCMTKSSVTFLLPQHQQDPLHPCERLLCLLSCHAPLPPWHNYFKGYLPPSHDPPPFPCTISCVTSMPCHARGHTEHHMSPQSDTPLHHLTSTLHLQHVTFNTSPYFNT